MQTQFRQTRRPVAAMALLVGAIAVTAFLPLPAEAQGKGFRAVAATGENGAVAGSRRVVSNGQGAGAAGGRFMIGDRQGNGAAASGFCATNVNAAGCMGRAATWGSDGTFNGAAAVEANGQNGSLSAQRNLQRNAEGNWSGASSVDAAGQNGSYSGNASRDNGTFSRDATYSGTEGNSATVEGNYQAGSGGSRSVTCIDASGAVIECP